MKIFLGVLLAATIAFGQGGAQKGGPAALKGFLGLTDNQVTSLMQIQQQQRPALQGVRKQMLEKRQALKQMMRAGNADAAAAGQLIADIGNLRKEVQAARAKTTEQALTILTPEQKAKLETLEKAMRAIPAVRQGVRLGLLAPPARPANQGN